MHQQINLFQPIFRKERKLFSFVVSLQTIGLFLVSFGVIYGYGLINLGQQSSQLETIKKQNATRMTQLATITQEVKAQGGGSEIDNEVERLKLELAAERFLLNVLGDAYQQHRVGFSGYLEAFARRSISGMWIAAFDMKNGGQSVRIQGGTMDPELIPKFIAGLSNEATLAGTEFEVFTMQRETPERQYIEFSLSSGDFSNSPFEAAND